MRKFNLFAYFFNQTLEISTLFLPKCTDCAVTKAALVVWVARVQVSPGVLSGGKARRDSHLPGEHDLRSSPWRRSSCSHTAGPPLSPAVATRRGGWGGDKLFYPVSDRETEPQQVHFYEFK